MVRDLGMNDLSDLVSNLSPADWRALLVAAAEHRCIACGECDGCECSDLEDVAKECVTHRAAALLRG